MKDLSLHILDIVQNSIRAKATLIGIEIDEQPNENQLIITITDNGTGMSPEQLQSAIDPFYTSRTTRKVGLGLSLFKQNAEMTGGSFSIESVFGKGTKVTAIFELNHLDRPIMGDLVGTLLILICSSDEINYVFKHKTPSGEYELDTREIRQTLENVPISNPDVRLFLKEMLQENLEQIQISE
ncbi:MAG: ATP-binding protein [Bacteroidota bacterium]|nr:ATP-binding protein [Bacteroidota bacterium]MDP3433529.1 ATP-binding protein [Bacteroidota bacterium]